MAPDTMSRAAKGRVAPPPRLQAPAQAVAQAVAQLPGVAVQAHWAIGSQTQVNGTDFYVGEEELGHIHLDGEAHVPVGQPLAQALIKSRLARRFPWSGHCVVVDTDDRDAALWVFGLRRAQLDGASAEALLGQVTQRQRALGT